MLILFFVGSGHTKSTTSLLTWGTISFGKKPCEGDEPELPNTEMDLSFAWSQADSLPNDFPSVSYDTISVTGPI